MARHGGKGVTRTSDLILWAIRLVLAGETLAALALGRWQFVFVATTALILTVAPGRLARRVGLRLPASFLAAIAIFVMATLYLGERFDFYERLWWWDIALHLGSALGFGLLGFLLIFMLFEGDRYAAPPWALGLLSFCVAMTVGLLWEVFEFAMDSLFSLNMQKSGLVDTMGDLMVNMVGGALAAGAGVLYLMRRAGGPLGGLFDLFIAENRSRFRKRFARRR
jgi:hypothetical protein